MSTINALARRGRQNLPFGVIITLLFFLIVLPLGVLGYASLITEAPRPGYVPSFSDFTLDNYVRLWTSGNRAAVTNSLTVGLFGGSLAMFLGCGMAWLAARTDVPGRALVGLAGIIPLFISSLVGAIAWSLIASPRAGYINLLFRDLGLPLEVNIYSLGGIVFVFGLYYAPYAFLFVYGALSLMNPELEEAASVHGAQRRAVLGNVTFPLVKPAMFGAGILTFVLVMENFPVPMVLGSPSGIDMMPSRIFRLMSSAPAQSNEASAVGVVLMILMAGLLWGQGRLLRGKSFVTVTGKGFRPRVIELGVWRWPAFFAVFLYIFLAAGLPFFALMQGALRNHQFLSNFMALFDPSAFTWQHVEATLSYRQFLDAIPNSIIVGVATGVIGGIFHFVLAYYVHKSNGPMKSKRIVEYVAMLPAATPALVIGIGFLWAWLMLPVPLYGTLAILVLAYGARFMPQGFRGIASSVTQIDKELEDAAYVSGASRSKATFYVTVPLMRTAVASTALLLFILSMRELSTSIFLYTSDTRVLSIVLYEQWSNGDWARVASLSILYSTALLLVTLIGRRWFGLGKPQ